MYTTPRASPTLATSDTHAREPRQSALSTCLPPRPSNYQSEGLRCPAARSVSSVLARRQRERSSNCTPRGTTDGVNKLTYFSTRKLTIIEPPVHDPSLFNISILFRVKKAYDDKVHCLTAKTADRPLTELRTMKQKNKGSKIGIKIKKRYKIKNQKDANNK